MSIFSVIEADISKVFSWIQNELGNVASPQNEQALKVVVSAAVAILGPQYPGSVKAVELASAEAIAFMDGNGQASLGTIITTLENNVNIKGLDPKAQAAIMSLINMTVLPQITQAIPTGSVVPTSTVIREVLVILNNACGGIVK